MSGDESSPGSVNPGSVQQPGLGLHGQQEGELLLQEEGRQRQAAAGDPPGPLTRLTVNQARASASANNSPEPKPAGESEDVETQPPQMSDIDALHASLQAAHDAAEAGRVREAKLRDELAASHQKTMEETIKRLEAEKVAIEAANEALRVTASAANAAKDAAEAAAASAASGSSVGGGGGMPTDAAKALAKDTSGAGP